MPHPSKKSGLPKRKPNVRHICSVSACALPLTTRGVNHLARQALPEVQRVLHPSEAPYQRDAHEEDVRISISCFDVDT